MAGSNLIAFCNALPLTIAGYTEGLSCTRKDFMHHYKRSRTSDGEPWNWQAYKDELVLSYQLLKNGYKNLGISFKDECTWGEFQQVVSNPEFQIVILFSHCIHHGTHLEQIEFYDGMVKSDEILQILPNQRRLYDFAVCNSTYLQQRITVEKCQSVAGTSNQAVKLAIWIAIYARVFEQMVANKKGFIEAMNNVFIEAKSKNDK